MSRDDRSLRVYFVTHPGGRLSGYLVRRRSWLFDAPPPSAFGASEIEVLDALETELQARLVRREEDLDRYLWTEEFATRQVTVPIHPATMVDKQPVIGRRQLPLRLTYAWTATESGAYRLMLPRFDWWILLQDLDTASAALGAAITGALLGAEPRDLYDFRSDGTERVQAHRPRFVKAAVKGDDPGSEAPPPALDSVADDWVRAAGRKKLPRLVGSGQLEHLEAMVRRWPRPSILLIGEGGVGKTSEVQRLARNLVRSRRGAEDVPGLWATSSERLLAGMVFVGMWQERLLKVIDEASRLGDILYVDRLLPLMAPQSSGASLLDLLLPAMRRGDLSVVAECSAAELSRARRIDPEAVDVFTHQRVAPPSPPGDAAPAAGVRRAQRPVVPPAGPSAPHRAPGGLPAGPELSGEGVSLHRLGRSRPRPPIALRPRRHRARFRPPDGPAPRDHQ